MSNEEIDAAIVRLVKDRAEARRRQAALAAELNAAAHVLQSLGQAPAYLNRAQISTEDPVALLNQHADLLEPSKLGNNIVDKIAATELGWSQRDRPEPSYKSVSAE